MIVGLFAILVFTGLIFSMFDFFLPFLDPAFLLSFRFMGIVFIFMGVLIIAIRLVNTGADGFVNIPKKNDVILIHSHRGKNPNASIMKAKLIDLEFIKAHRKIFKDTGGGVRICGHDVRFTHETIAHDIPLWLGQYFHQLKKDYGVHNNRDLIKLHLKLKTIRKPIANVMSLEDQLKNIVEIKPLLEDPEKRKFLLGQSVEDLQQMAECVWDGKVVHMEDIEEFIESAPPNELDSLMTQENAHNLMRIKKYTDPGEINWGTWVPIVLVLLLGGAIAVAIIAGVFS